MNDFSTEMLEGLRQWQTREWNTRKLDLHAVHVDILRISSLINCRFHDVLTEADLRCNRVQCWYLVKCNIDIRYVYCSFTDLIHYYTRPALHWRCNKDNRSCVLYCRHVSETENVKKNFKTKFEDASIFRVLSRCQQSVIRTHSHSLLIRHLICETFVNDNFFESNANRCAWFARRQLVCVLSWLMRHTRSDKFDPEL